MGLYKHWTERLDCVGIDCDAIRSLEGYRGRRLAVEYNRNTRNVGSGLYMAVAGTCDIVEPYVSCQGKCGCAGTCLSN